MSKSKLYRLMPEDIEILVTALDCLHASSIVSPVTNPDYAIASLQRMNQIKAKLNWVAA